MALYENDQDDEGPIDISNIAILFTAIAPLHNVTQISLQNTTNDIFDLIWDANVSIRAVSGGLPVGPDLGSTGIIHMGGVGVWSTSEVLANPVTLEAGTVYAIVILPIDYNGCRSPALESGAGDFSYIISYDDGDTWVDLGFYKSPPEYKIYGNAVSPPLPPQSYNVFIKAHCNTENHDIEVAISEDNILVANTPYGFTLTGDHTFTVPDIDPSGHPFKIWSTGEHSTTLSVSIAGEYIAVYKEVFTPPSPPTEVDRYPDDFDETPITTTDFPFTTTYPEIAKTLVKGNTTNCVWCGKAMLASEADIHGRCDFDSYYPFTNEGKVESIADRGEIAIRSIHLGILP